jgi:alpha-mannosidase
MWSVAAANLSTPGPAKDFEFPAERMNAAWKKVLLNQFHDIIPGSSIQRVYQEAEADYAQVIAAARDVIARATGTLTFEDDALTVFNSLSWERKILVPLPSAWYGAKDDDRLLTTQTIDGTVYVEVSVPPCGWKTIRPEDPLAMASGLEATPTRLENDRIRVQLDDLGRVTSIYDKEANRELAAGLCNNLKMYKDIPTNWDAWDLDSMYEETPVTLGAPATVSVLDSGPLVAQVEVKRTLNQSEMTQTIRLRRGSRRVDFHTVIDWRESHKLLKVNFAVNVHNAEGLHEIQFGHIARPTHKSRPFDADRFEVCNHKWTALTEGNRGVALLNDCKYGVNVDGNSINLTLLKSALAPDMYADKGRQEFTYALYAWNGPLYDSGLVQEGYDLNVETVTALGNGGERSLFEIDAPNILIETVKPSEDGSGDIVLRMYESMRTATHCTLRTSLPVKGAMRTNMLEEIRGELELKGSSLALDFRPFEIKTVRFVQGPHV